MSIVYTQPCISGTLIAFALVSTFVPTADDLYVNLAWLGGVPDIEILVNGVVVSEDYVISVNGS